MTVFNLLRANPAADLNAEPLFQGQTRADLIQEATLLHGTMERVNQLCERYGFNPEENTPLKLKDVRFFYACPFFNLLEANPAADHNAYVTQNCEITDVAPEGDPATAWDEFRDTFIAKYGQDRFDRLCQRYHFDFDAHRTRPLRVRHLRLFYVGRTPLSSRSIKELIAQDAVNWPKLKDLPTANIRSLLEEELSHRRLLPSPLSTRCFYDPLFYDQEKLRLSADLANLQGDAWLERVTKSLSTTELEVREVIPRRHADGTLYFYKVHAKVSASGCIAYALKPLTLDTPFPPLLVFRPTAMHFSDEGMIDNWVDNFTWNYGQIGYQAAEAGLDAIMDDPRFCPPGCRIELAGYSLGAAHAQYCAIHQWHRYLEAHPNHNVPFKIGRLTSYNSPGIAPQVVRDFNTTLQNLPPGDPMIIEPERTVGDLLQQFGGVHLGWELPAGQTWFRAEPRTVQLPPNEFFRPDLLHQMRAHDLTQNIRQVHPETNPMPEDANPSDYLGGLKRTDLRWWEAMRPIIGVMAIAVLQLMRDIAVWLGRIFGVQIVRARAEEEIPPVA